MKQGQEVRLPAKSTSFKEWSERLGHTVIRVFQKKYKIIGMNK